MSSGRVKVVADIARYADTEVLSLKDLERLVALGSFGAPGGDGAE